MKTKNKCLVTSLAIIAMLMMSLGVKAQTVHIGLDNGSLMNGYVPGTDSGWEAGFSTLWRHEQLSLTMLGSDRDGILESGLINYPSAVFGKHSNITHDDTDHGITIVGGRRPSYIVVSLPKGYRITGYTIVLANDLIGANLGGRFNNLNLRETNERVNPEYGTMRFCEVKPWTTDETNSGTHKRLSDEDNDGYNLTRVRYIEGGTDWQHGEIGSEVIEWARDNQGNYDIKTNEYVPGDPNAPQPKLYTLQRTAREIGKDQYQNPIYDMDNNLYFRLVKDYTFYGLTIKDFRIEFTAEGTFEADIVPAAKGPETSAIGVPFSTSKIDIGKMNEISKVSNGQNYTHYAFTAENVKDLEAYNWLYQEHAVSGGIPYDVLTDKKIRPVEVEVNNKKQLLYALKTGTYFLETPVEITNQYGNTAPIGYRIVGALFTPLWGSDVSEEIEPGRTEYHIKYESNGTTYYLNASGYFAETENPTVWVSDNNGIHSGNSYLTRRRDGNNYSLSIGTQNTGNKLTLRNNHLCWVNGNTTYYLQGTTVSSVRPQLTTSTDDLPVWIEETIEPKIDYIYTSGSYKLKIWKRDGSGLIHWQYDNDLGYKQTDDGTKPDYIEITGENDTNIGKVIDMGLCNNDAIKFEIETTATGENAGRVQALVKVTLLLQALDPYIDKMDIVCHDEPNSEGKHNLELTQSFTADDFSVSGGRFIFYVPEDYANDMLTFTFSDLYSKYGDETYYRGGSGSSRYSFVSSEYFDKIDGYGEGDDGLYDSDYNPNHPYNGYPNLVNGVEKRTLSKIETTTAGNIRFKFNNAEELQEGGTQPANAELEEYPFSVATYYISTDPGDPLSTPPHSANSSVHGEFDRVQLQASSQTQHSGTYFVFTADETRWNIATETTKWQHRYYAFYRMEIELQAKTFNPLFSWNKVYNDSFYATKNDQGEEIDAEDSMWGLTLDVSNKEQLKDKNGNPVVDENGDPVFKPGYLTYQEIIDHVKGRKYTEAEAAAYNEEKNYQPGDDGYVTTESWRIMPTLDNTNTSAPKSMKQILYVDGTPLYAMLNSSQHSEVKRLEDLKKELGINALVFLPENTTSTLDNVAFITSSELDDTKFFRAGKDIVLTDKQPFFSPYDIQIDAANYAKYTRNLTHEGYDLDVNATIMLPFTLYLNSGLHTNEDNSCSFTVNKMHDGTPQMNLVGGSRVDYGTAFFIPVTGQSTEANKPYMIHVESVTPPSATEDDGDDTSDEGSESGSNSQNQATPISFIAKQKGALIVATPKTAAETPKAISELNTSTNPEPEPYCTGLLHMGESASALFGSDTYDFTNYGSFSGSKYDRAVSENVFYFGKNRYVNLHTLWPGTQQYMYCYPFRGVYIYTTTAPSPSKEMKWFDISFDEYQGNFGIATGITDVDKVIDLMVQPGKGSMTITSTREQNVYIYSANGVRIERVSLNNGETRIVNIPAGIYIVNNVKVIVK